MTVDRQTTKTKVDMRAGVAFNHTHKRSQEQDSMDGQFQDQQLQASEPSPDAEEAVATANPAVAEFEDSDGGDDWTADWTAEDDLMTIVDPMIDKASRERDDSAIDDDLDDSEFDDDVQFEQLDEFMSDEPEEPDDMTDLDSDSDMDVDDFDTEMDDDLDDDLKVPMTASQQALEARRAIEERAEARRIERDLNYLDFELDD